jgi:hypothetical protein
MAQSTWITPQQPWFNLSVAVGEAAVPADQLHVNLTFYNRLDNGSQFAQAAGGVPQKGVLGRLSDLPVTEGLAGRVSVDCVTVVRDSADVPPSSGLNACGAGSTTLTLDCTPESGSCGDVYPVSVALLRQGSPSPLARFTTFLTYQEPGRIGTGGPLRVGVVVNPATAGALDPVATALADHRDVPTTLAVSPLAVQQALVQHTREDVHALAQLSALGSDQVIDQPYAPVNVAAMAQAGIGGEILAQVDRGNTLLRQAGLRPSAGPWVDTVSNFNQGDGPGLAAGIAQAGAQRLVVSDGDLAAGGLANYTFAQPFTLDLGRGAGIPALAADSTLSSRFTAQPADPVLGAEQLLAGLSFVHFEDAFVSDPRGLAVVPPPGWQPSKDFLETLLAGLTGNPALTGVTLDQLFSQVQPGGNGESTMRRLQAGPASGGISRASAQKIAVARTQLSSFADAVSGHPEEMTALSDTLLATEARDLSGAGRTAALIGFQRAFDDEIGKISIATERTVTFTAGRAPIPITVLSATSYPLRVVMTLASDKFTFPSGNTRTLLLQRPTTSVRVVAQASTSGDRLPIDVTLRTPDGQLLLARTVLTVQSTAISFVGVALTVFAGAVLLLWWGRTWLRSRRRRASVR